MRTKTTLLLALALLAVPSVAYATTYNVGPTRAYKQLTDVATLLKPSDLVLVDGGSTYAAVRFTQPGSLAGKITIRGVLSASGARPIVSGGANSIEAAGDHYVFETLEITGGTSRCFYHHADDVTLRDSVIHDCPAQGILGADQDSGSLSMEYDEVYKCGNGTQNHQIYMATDEVAHPGAIFRMQYCYVHDGNGGNNVKSRAERNEIYFNWIEGSVYHELELIGPDPGGAQASWTPALKREDSDVVGNVIRATSSSSSVTRLGGDGTGASSGRYRFVANSFELGATSASVFWCFDAIESVEMHDNLFFLATGAKVDLVRDVYTGASPEVTWTSGTPQIAGSNNWIPTGSTTIPASWTATILGADPKLVAVASYDLDPDVGSPLIDAGTNATTTSAPGYPFPNPLALPTFLPPRRVLEAVGSAAPRVIVGAIDVGAYEAVTAGGDGGIVDAGSDTGVGTDGGATDSGTSTDDTGVALDDGGATTDDGGTSTDSGASLVDASSADGATPAADAASSGGCGCETPGPRRTGALASALLLGVMAAAGSRRRGRRTT